VITIPTSVITIPIRVITMDRHPHLSSGARSRPAKTLVPVDRRAADWDYEPALEDAK
jgi:hypothetical protein